MINDYVDEFVKRIYLPNESTERIPKIANYYKNYLNFFCNPMFRNFKVNNIIQSYGDHKAELYYNKNYGKKKDNDHFKSIDDCMIFYTTIRDNIDKNCLTKTTIKIDNSNDLIMNNILDSHINFNNSLTTLQSNRATARSREESLMNILTNLENKNENKANKVIKPNKSITHRFSIDKTEQKMTETINEFIRLSSYKSNHSKKSIELPDKINFVQLKPTHTKNSESINEKKFISNINTPIVGSSRQSTKIQSNDKFKRKIDSATNLPGSFKLALKKRNLHDNIDKKSSNSDMKTKSSFVNNLNSINDIMKITLSVCVDKSSRNRPLSNNFNTAINPTTPNYTANTKKTTIINKIDNINNFNININTPIIADNIATIQLPINKIVKSDFNLLDRNKIFSRNKNTSLYKISTATFKQDEVKKVLKESDTKLFSTYNGKYL
jgi:hypothetical protein